MMDHTLGRALNYGQSMVPGKAKPNRQQKNVKKAVLQKKKAPQAKG